MPLLLSMATPKEMTAAVGGAAPLPPQGGMSEAVLHGRACLLLCTGVGPVNAALALGRVLGAAETRGTLLDGVLCLGVAGSFSLDALPLRAACVVAHETWPEYGLAGDGPGADPRGLGLAQGALPDGQEVWDTLDLAPDAALERAGLHPVPDLPRVRGLTVAGVSAAPRRARTLDARYGADVESMEGFAVAWACALAGTPCVQARIVSNLAGARPPEHWDLDGALAALPGLLERLLAPRP